MKKLRTPQEKKLFSYQKDCRNTYGERGSNSRYAIATQKALNRRAYRHCSDQVLRVLNNTETVRLNVLDDADLKIKTVVKRGWQKCPDSPLREVVERKLKRRKEMGTNTKIKMLLRSVSDEQ